MTAGRLGLPLAVGLALGLAVVLLLPPPPTRRLRRALGHRPGLAGRALVSLARGLLARVRLGAAARRRLARRRAVALDTGAALAAELRAGQPVRTALVRAAAAHDPPACPAAAAAARLGGDVPAALRRDAARGRLPLLRGLAACWEVGESSGAGLASAVERLVAAGRVAEDVRVQLEAQLAGPRATARMLATLPLVGLALGTLLGADPLAWLLGTGLGLACLGLGGLLTAAGLMWTARISAGVERLL